MSNRTTSTVEVAQMGTFWVACDPFHGISVIGGSAAEAYKAVSDAIFNRLAARYPSTPFPAWEECTACQ